MGADGGPVIRRRLLLGMGANGFRQLVGIAIQLVNVPIFAATLGVERYGIWLMLFTIPSYLLISDFGFAKAATTEINMRLAAGRVEEAQCTFQSSFAVLVTLMAVLVPLIVAICFALPADWLGSTAASSEEVRLTMLVFGLYSMLVLGHSLLMGALQASGNFAVDSFALSLIWMLEAGLAVTGLLVGQSLAWAASGYLFGRLIAIIAYRFLLPRYAPKLRLGLTKARMSEARRLVKPAVTVMVLPTANALLLQLTTVIVGFAASTTVVPVFTTVRTLCRVGVQMGNIVTYAVMPEFGAARGRSDKAIQLKLAVLVTWVTAVILVPLALMLLLIGPEIIQLWTHGAVHPPFSVIAFMVLMMLANGFWTQFSNLLVAVNGQARFARALLVVTCVTVMVCLILARAFGATGGAMALALNDLLMCVIITRVFGREVASIGTCVRSGPQLFRDYSGNIFAMARAMAKR